MSKTSPKKIWYFASSFAVALILITAWYMVDRFLDTAISQTFASWRAHDIQISFKQPSLTGFSWSTLSYYRHYEGLRIKKSDEEFFIPLCTLQVNPIDLAHQRVDVKGRGTVRASSKSMACALESIHATFQKKSSAWHMRLSAPRGKLFYNKDFLCSLNTLAVSTTPEATSKKNAGYHTQISSQITFTSRFLDQMTHTGSINVSAHVTPEQITLSRYEIAVLKMHFSGKGSLERKPDGLTGNINVDLKGWNYQLSLLCYTLSLHFRKTSELKHFLNQMIQKRNQDTQNFTLMVRPDYLQLKEVPFIRFNLPLAF